ncbi:hypothetical protein [Alkalicoccobacillus gibsonii]|uniref:hypothetical protein n=1 Tax=Alkalicoccobacillus gibsonii TaxID=79881 RepID=UPI0019314BCC|nr:hypothetical protein [Alkalicoccobacillus gibsonii]MBM0064801.1 hypothetical protein [Alkalicoccobacillus gibsonii]
MSTSVQVEGNVYQVFGATMVKYYELCFICSESADLTSSETIGDLNIRYDRKKVVVYSPADYKVTFVTEDNYGEEDPEFEHAYNLKPGQKLVSMGVEVTVPYVFASSNKERQSTLEDSWNEYDSLYNQVVFEDPILFFPAIGIVGVTETYSDRMERYEDNKLGNTHYQASFQTNGGILVVDYLGKETDNQDEIAKIVVAQSLSEAATSENELATLKTNLTLISTVIQ